MPIDPATSSLLTGVLAKLNLDGLMPMKYRRRLIRERAQLKVLESTIEAAGEAQIEAARKGEMVFSSEGEPMPLAWGLRKEMLRLAAQHGADSVAAALAASVSDAIRRQDNLVAAIEAADAVLAEDPTPEATPPPPNDDWLFRWRDHASEVSSEELQSLWGRVLASEVKSPGAFGLRTLEFLRSISSHEAKLIDEFASIVFGDFVLRDLNFLNQLGFTLSMLLELQELGILSGVESIGLERTLTAEKAGTIAELLEFDDQAVLITSTKPGHVLKLPCYLVTKLGQQVLKLGLRPRNTTYFEKVIEIAKAQEWKVQQGKCQKHGAELTILDPIAL